ncbi:MAG: choice-of-anchor Q domain-containing protein [Acidimicrobiales bacterium]
MTAGFGRHTRTLLAGSLLVGGAVAVSVFGGSLPASAQPTAALYVTTSGTGTCSQASPCGSIQTAITAAEAGPYNGDDVTINVAAGTYTENDTVSASSLDSLTIAGAGASTTTVNGDKAGTVFTINSGTVTVSGLTIENGSVTTSSSVPGFEGGGGVLNSGRMTIDSSTVSGNSVTIGTNGPVADGGGGIYNGGTMTIDSSTVSGNSVNVTTNDGGVVGGGGIQNGGESGATMTMDSSTVSGNSVNVGTNDASVDGGGGIQNGFSGGTITVDSSTVSGNSVTDSDSDGGFDSGGGMQNGFSAGTITIDSSTVSGNTVTDTDSDGGFDGGGGIRNGLSGATVDMGATILANNGGSDCSGGTVNDLGYNIADDDSCGFTASTSTNSSTTLDASLGSLADNGGPTLTILPALGSPAIGVIPSSPATTLNSVQVCPRTDQRGVANYGNCTIGAVEGGFLITTTSLHSATLGSPYVPPVTLTTQEAGVSTKGHTTFKWKKVASPKGLKLSTAGVLSGTPSATTPSSVRVEVTETVTTLNGTKKVRTKTTVEATIPLTIA